MNDDLDLKGIDGTVWVPLPLEKLATYDGYCCRVWPLAIGVPVGRCGICGERPRRMAEGVIK